MSKKTFVVDENIIYHAINGVDHQNNTDTSSALFLELLAKNCHKIYWEKRMIQKYLKIIGKIKRERKPNPVPKFDLLMNQILLNQSKYTWVENEVPVLDDQTGVSSEDIFLIENSLHSGFPIVTNDGTLKEEIAAKENLNIEILTAKEAIPLVSQE